MSGVEALNRQKAKRQPLPCPPILNPLNIHAGTQQRRGEDLPGRLIASVSPQLHQQCYLPPPCPWDTRGSSSAFEVFARVCACVSRFFLARSPVSLSLGRDHLLLGLVENRDLCREQAPAPTESVQFRGVVVVVVGTESWRGALVLLEVDQKRCGKSPSTRVVSASGEKANPPACPRSRIPSFPTSLPRSSLYRV